MLLIHLAKRFGIGLIFVAFITVLSLGFTGVSSAEKSGEARKIVTTDFVDLKFTINKTSYTSKKASKSLEIAPYIVDGRTLVPFRTIFEELGYNIVWDDATKSITATYKGNVIKLEINNKKAIVDGKEVILDVAPEIVKSRTVVPLRFVAENSGSFVNWNPDEKSITISRVGKFATGTVLFYDQKGKVPKVYI